VVPIALAFGEPEPDAALRPGTPVPDHITRLGAGNGAARRGGPAANRGLRATGRSA